MKPCCHDSHEKFNLLIEPLRAEARRLGYALAVHGSLVRDIDLIACPWTTAAVSAPELAEALRLVAAKVNGYAECRDKIGAANPEFFDQGSPGAKPHGRRNWCFHLMGGPYIDLSVMPRAPREKPC